MDPGQPSLCLFLISSPVGALLTYLRLLGLFYNLKLWGSGFGGLLMVEGRRGCGVKVGVGWVERVEIIWRLCEDVVWVLGRDLWSVEWVRGVITVIVENIDISHHLLLLKHFKLTLP